MMDHIRQRDWCSSRIDHTKFVDEEDIRNCVVERIVQNRFFHPLVSSDDEEPAASTIDWDHIFKKKNNKQQNKFRCFVPGFRRPPPYPKISALTSQEQFQCIKVLCSKNEHILPKFYIGRPTKIDFRVFEEKKEIYEAEQKEYIEWAKHLWQTTNCIRALRPNTLIETIYDAEYNMKSQMIESFPMTYAVAAQIPLTAPNHNCEMFLPKTDLIKVDISKLPKVSYPNIFEDKVSIMTECPLPQPCKQHPCNFILPNKTEPSILPLTELNKELAQFAAEHNAEFLVSEQAAQCLLETDRAWSLPLSVCEVVGPEGVSRSVVVVGEEVPSGREPAPARSYRALRHLLVTAFTDKTSRSKSIAKKLPNNKIDGSPRKAAVTFNNAVRKVAARDSDDDDDDERLQIDLNYETATDSQTELEDNVSSTNANGNNATNTPPRKILKPKRRKSQNHSDETNQDNHSNESINKDNCNMQEDETESEINELTMDVSETENDGHTEHKNSENSHVDDNQSIKMDDQSADKDNLDSINNDNQDSISKDNLDSISKDNLDSISKDNEEVPSRPESQTENNINEIFHCVCKDTQAPRPRSYKKVQIRNHSTNENINVIIHSSHQLRKELSVGEVLLEPIVEYQLDLGGTMLSPQKMKSLAFSLMLRKHSDLALVRVDASCGEVVSVQVQGAREWCAPHAHCGAVPNSLHTALAQLQGLLPGHYLLRHEVSHGDNALLLTRAAPPGLPRQSEAPLTPALEAKLVQIPPPLAPVLLPYHKYRRTLPLAFTHNPKMVAKENPNKASNKPKLPPAAIQSENGSTSGGKWPKKKGRKKKGKK